MWEHYTILLPNSCICVAVHCKVVILEKLRSENNCKGDLYKKLAQNITAIAVKDNKKCSINTYNTTETFLSLPG